MKDKLRELQAQYHHYRTLSRMMENRGSVFAASMYKEEIEKIQKQIQEEKGKTTCSEN